MKEKKSYHVFERGKTIGRQLVLQKKLPQKRKVSVDINPGEKAHARMSKTCIDKDSIIGKER